MHKFILAVFGVLGCFFTLLLVASEMYHYQGSDSRLIDDAKDAMRAGLIDPASATFEGLRVVKHEQGRIVCGLVNAKNRLGGYGGRREFLYNGHSAVIYGKDGTHTEADAVRLYRAEVLACDPWREETRKERQQASERLRQLNPGLPTLGGPGEPPKVIENPQVPKDLPALLGGRSQVIQNPHFRGQ